MSYTYESAILGGSFDHFHTGHEQFIVAAFAKAKHVTIGIVKDLKVENKPYTGSRQDYQLRENSLRSFLSKLNVEARATIIPIYDIYGTSLTDKEINAIFVTDSTYPNAKKINLERKKLGLPEIKIILVPYVLGDDGTIISSGRIREGIIDRSGASYLKFFMKKTSYLLPDNLRDTLQQPIGQIVQDLNNLPRSANIISVGDIVSIYLKQSKHVASISIIDYRTRRQALSLVDIDKFFPIKSQEMSNPAGTINKEIAQIFLSSLQVFNQTKKTQLIAVRGEEDLLALPSILLAPLGSYVIYGQYNVGMCLVEITEDIKTTVKHYLEQFN